MEERDYNIIKDYFLEEYSSIIKYILTYDALPENKYIINIETNPINEEISTLTIKTKPNNNNNHNYSVSKNIEVTLPNNLIKQIINAIREDFTDNHYIIYSSLNLHNLVQTLQNEKFTVLIKLASPDEINEIIDFNDKINLNDRHKTKVLTLKY